jgi:hypothetical protein
VIKKIILFLLLLLILFSAFVFFYPAPIDPQAWTPPVDVGLTGQYAPNNALSALHKMADGKCNRCEDVAVDSLGNVYAGDVAGNILAFSPVLKTVAFWPIRVGGPWG